MTEQKLQRFPVLGGAARAKILNRDDADSPFSKIVGQNGAVESIMDLLDSALKDECRLTPHPALLFCGGRSNGKTTMARVVANALGRRMVETDGNLIKSPDDIFDLAIGACREIRCPVIQLETRNGKPFYKLPNIVIFIDEIHALKNSAVMGLLKALEPKDRMLLVKDGYVDVSNVLWIGATTERGQLFSPFESRFYKVQMLDYTLEEVSKIVKVNFPTWSSEDCMTIAYRGGKIAREAISLAQAVTLNAARIGCSIMSAIENVCQQKGIDERGLTKQQTWVLQALADKPQGLNYEQLCRIAQCNVEELKRYVLPPLLVYTENSPAMVVWTGQRSCLTKKGAEMLESMGLHVDETLFNAKNGE